MGSGWYGPLFMFTISGVDSLEARLQAAQEELGIPPSGWVPVTYRAQSDTLSVCCIIYSLVYVYCVYAVLQCPGAGCTQHSASFEGHIPIPVSKSLRS